MIYTFLSFQTSKFYVSWKRMLKLIPWFEIDKVFLEFSKYDFIAKTVKHKKKILVSRLHNVEHDYSKNEYRLKKDFRHLLIYLLSKKREQTVVRLSNSIIFLTYRDARRASVLYKNVLGKTQFFVIPVAIEKPGLKLRNFVKNERMTLLLSGSLWYGPNYEGIIWFFKNVYGAIKQNFRVILAGSRPTSEIINTIGEDSNVKIYKDVDNMSDIYSMSDIALIPIFSGSGMKIKVADALAHKMLIVATDEALTGYKLRDKTDCFVFSDIIDLIKTLQTINDMTEIEIQNIINNGYDVFQKNNTINSCVRLYCDVIEHNQ